MSVSDHIVDIKTRKDNILSESSTSVWNHPHRLRSIEVSGNLSYTIDQRSFSSPGVSAQTYEFSLDFSLAASWSRRFETNTPWYSGALPGGPLATGQFYFGHTPEWFWEAFTQYGSSPSAVKIGDCVQTSYSRPTTSDPWTLGATVTTDVDFYFSAFLSLGGEPDSGGKGDESDDEKIVVAFLDSFTGANTSRLPDFSADVLRLPWEDSWASETAAFSDIFSDHIAARNAADGGGHSGTCTLSLDFST